MAAAFNLTPDRLEKAYIVQREFLADAAHELKTPLALVRAQIDMDGTSDRQVLLQDIDRMARQVNQLLHLPDASETHNYIFEPVDLAELAEDIADYLRRLAERHQVYVEVRLVTGSSAANTAFPLGLRYDGAGGCLIRCHEHRQLHCPEW